MKGFGPQAGDRSKLTATALKVSGSGRTNPVVVVAVLGELDLGLDDAEELVVGARLQRGRR